MITHPEPSATGDVDQVLVDRARTSAEYLTGLVAAGMLERVGRPTALPALLFPDADPDTVQEVWNTALAVGYQAGKCAARPVWDTAALDRLRTALYEAGYRGMGKAVERTAYAAPSRPAPAGQDHGDTTGTVPR